MPFMNSLKAIISGVLFIFITALLMQLAYIFIAVAYNNLAKDYPYLHEISGIFRYLIAIPLFLGIMLMGGYLTAAIAKSKELLHCIIVAAIAIFTMMWFALSNAELTPAGVVINILMLLFTVFGGWYWKYRNKKRETQSI